MIERISKNIGIHSDFLKNLEWIPMVINVNGIIFEIGGKNKTLDQIKHLNNSYLALDDIKVGFKNIIPLWLFGFLY